MQDSNKLKYERRITVNELYSGVSYTATASTFTYNRQPKQHSMSVSNLL